MDSDEVYKIIGYIVAVIFFIYLISKAFRLNVRVIEGLSFGSNKKDDKKDDNKSSGFGSNNSGGSSVGGGGGSGIRDNKGNEKSTEDDDKKIIVKEKENDEIKKNIVKKKELYKDALSASYNHVVYSLIEVSSRFITDDFTSNDVNNGLMNQIKRMKDTLDVLDFAYNEVVNLS